MPNNPTQPMPDTQIEQVLEKFDEIGFGNQARIVGTKRVELRSWLTQALKDYGDTVRDEAIGVGYSLATGKAFASFSSQQEFYEELFGRPILTHEFADEDIWDKLRMAYEEKRLKILKSKDSHAR